MMSHKKSHTTVTKNKKTWTKNLVRFQESHRRRGSVAVEEHSLDEKSRIPLQLQIVGRYQFLGAYVKGRKERIDQISKEITKLWDNKLNFPRVSDQVIRAKLMKVLKVYDECVKRGKYDVLNALFDITKVNGQWLSSEDKRLYHLQKESKGQVGYSTGQVASKETIHPSKRRKVQSGTAIPSTSQVLSTTDSGTESENCKSKSEDDEDDDGDKDDDEDTQKKTRKHYKSKFAVSMVTSSGVSTKKAAKICNVLSQQGIDIPTPSQSAIYKSIFKEAGKLKKEMIQQLKMEQWSLHFDGKRIDDKEYQVVVLQNERTDVKLDALRLKDGKAETVAEKIDKLIDEYNLWNSIKMIITDTTNVNTGKRNGVVVKLQRMFKLKGVTIPQFIGCQHHVLDRILRLVMDEELGGDTKSPNIEYPFVSELLNKYDELKDKFVNGTVEILDKSGWRDDMKFLYHLTRVFRFYEEQRNFPLIHFQNIPNMSNARWNSRAILAILAFILMPEARKNLEKVCRFISYEWAEHWFSSQKYNDNDFKNLSDVLKPYKKALQSFKNHWKKEPSVIDIPRSNQIAERAIKVMQDLYASCRKKDKLQLRFILSNKR